MFQMESEKCLEWQFFHAQHMIDRPMFALDANNLIASKLDALDLVLMNVLPIAIEPLRPSDTSEENRLVL